MISVDKHGWRFEASRCSQCGVCVAICPRGALSFVRTGSGFTVRRNAGACNLCGACARVCPAAMPQGIETIRDIVEAKHIGLWHAVDSEVRSFGSSGGVTRALIREALTSGYCDAVYSLHSREGADDASGEWFCAYPAEEEAIPTSLYRPVFWGAGLNRIDAGWKRVMVVGLPCQIRAAKMFLSRVLPHTELLLLTIFCKKQKTNGYSHYFLRKLGVSRRKIAGLRYRGNGWPGQVRMAREHEPRATSCFFPRLCWNLPGCRYCTTSLNRKFGDLTIADPWGLITPSPAEPGRNLVMAWSDTGMALLRRSNAIVCTGDVTPDQAARAVVISYLEEKSEDLTPARFGSRRWRCRRAEAAKKFCGEIFLNLKSFFGR